MSFVIRKGNKEDVPGIFRLIKELAEFERAPEAVLNNEKMLLEDGFGKNPIYFVLVAEDLKTNEIIGMALYCNCYSSWKGKMYFLDDLVVNEKYRRNGIGRKLMNEFLKDAHANNVNMVKWQVLEWNEPAINFYKSLGAEFDAEWIDCKIFKNDLAALVSKL